LGKSSISGKANGTLRTAPRSAGTAASGKQLRPAKPARPGVGRDAPTRAMTRAPTALALRDSDNADASHSASSPAIRLGWREAIERTVTGLGYEVVDVERALRGLLRVTIDRVPGTAYPSGASEFVLVEDCEAVTRQLQYALEVDGVDYARLEVSSPGLDRPIRREADYARFVGEQVSIALKLPFQGRKVFKGVLGRVDAAPEQATEQGVGWTLVIQDGKNEQVLAFTLDEVREARLVPVVNFKGRQGKTQGAAPEADVPALDGGQGR
jgi:ribosome maturation factor RimP